MSLHVCVVFVCLRKLVESNTPCQSRKAPDARFNIEAMNSAEGTYISDTARTPLALASSIYKYAILCIRIDFCCVRDF